MDNIAIPRELLQEAEIWIDGALECKEWNWSPDQWEAAAVCREKLRALLKPAEPIMKVNDRQRAVLLHLNEDDEAERYSPIRNIAIDFQWPENDVRLILRALTRKGLAERVPFFDNDGYIRGSGYGITEVGRKLVAEIGGAA